MMIRPSAFLRLFAIVVIAMGLLVAMPTRAAAVVTNTWSGAVDANWSSAGNWSAGVPVSTELLVFPSGGANRTMVDDLGSTITIGGMSVLDQYHLAAATTETLGVTGGLVATNSMTITLPVAIAGTVGITVTGTFASFAFVGVVSEGVPGSGLLVQGPSGQLDLVTANTFTGGVTIQAGSNATITCQNSACLGTGPLVIADGGDFNPIGTLSIANAITVSGASFGGATDSAITVAGSTTFSGPLTLAANSTIGTVNATDVASFTGGVSGPFAVSLIGTAGSQMVLSTTAATNSGGWNVGGSVTLLLSTTPGTGTVTVTTPAELVVGGAGSPYSNALVLNGGGPGGSTSLSCGSTATWSGPVTLQTADVNITDGSSAACTLSGAVSGSVNVDFFNGTGAWILSGTNTGLSGSITLHTGTLQVDGDDSTSAVNALAGSLLKGTGSMGLTTITGATLAPGDSPGTISAGSLALNAASILQEQIDGVTAGTLYDQTVVNGGGGSVVLGGAALQVALGFTPTPGNNFTVIQNLTPSAVSGTFAGLPEGAEFMQAGQRFRITYAGGAGHDVVLTAIETSTLSLSSSVNPAAAGQSLTLTATVGFAAGPPASGQVSFFDGSTLLGSVLSNGQGVATFNVVFTTVGVHSLTARFAGAPAVGASVSPVLAQTVTAAAVVPVPTTGVSDTGSAASGLLRGVMGLALGLCLLATALWFRRRRLAGS